jgi:hypothetical protein
MANSFWKAPEEIEEMANDLIAEYHNDIVGADIRYWMKDEASAAEAEASQVCVAKKASGLLRAIAGDADFIIVIASDLWTEIGPAAKQAMLDSALTSCSAKLDDAGDFKLDKTGNPAWAVKPFDIIQHSDIITRHGFDVLKDAGNIIRVALEEAKQNKDAD